MQPLENREINKSHCKSGKSLVDLVEEIKSKIISRGNLSHVSVETQLDILNQFCQFPLGRYIIEAGGANGFWTDYMVSHPDRGKITGLNIEEKPFSALEDFFLNECPIVVAHQERFRIFQSLLQKELKEHAVLASIPCGLMRDLLTLNFSSISDYSLIGVDIDEESLILAKELANKCGVKNINLVQQDAWGLTFQNELDVIASSGLNVYESDKNRIIDLYKKFFSALKPGGVLIISVLTYPPSENKICDWDLENMLPEVLLKDRILHQDILDIKWRNFRAICELNDEFKQVGFSDIKIYFDARRVFPTIYAKKSG